MNQMPLFEAPRQFTDARLDAKEQVRLNRQCVAILRYMVSRERVSNSELNEVAFRYSARIYDLKKAGIGIEIVERNRETGVNWYAFYSPDDRARALAALSESVNDGAAGPANKEGSR